MATTLELGMDRFVKSFVRNTGPFDESQVIQSEEASTKSRLRKKSEEILDSFGSHNVPPGGFYLRQTPDATIVVSDREFALKLCEVDEGGKSYVIYGTSGEEIKNRRVFTIPTQAEGTSLTDPSNWENKKAELDDLKLAEALLETLETRLTEQTSL